MTWLEEMQIEIPWQPGAGGRHWYSAGAYAQLRKCLEVLTGKGKFIVTELWLEQIPPYELADTVHFPAKEWLAMMQELE